MDYVDVTQVEDCAGVSTTEDMGNRHRGVLTESHGAAILWMEGTTSFIYEPFLICTHLKLTPPPYKLYYNSNLTNSRPAR